MSCVAYFFHRIDIADQSFEQCEWQKIVLLRAALISQHLPIAERDALLRCASYDFGVTLMSFGPRLAAQPSLLFLEPLPLRLHIHILPPTPIPSHTQSHDFHTGIPTSATLPIALDTFLRTGPATIAPRVAWRGTAKGGQGQDR